MMYVFRKNSHANRLCLESMINQNRNVENEPVIMFTTAFFGLMAF